MKDIILLKPRRRGSTFNYANYGIDPFDIHKINIHNLKNHIYKYLGEYAHYVNSNYKQPLTEQENNTINTLIQSDLIENLELAKQIILTKLNYNE